MKKKFVMFLMTVMLSFSAVCFASYGTDLDAETKMAEQFFAGNDYKKVSAFMGQDFAKALTAEKYKEFFANVEKDAGKVVGSKLRVIEKYDDADVLHYFIDFEKVKNVKFIAVFKKVDSKIVLFEAAFPNPNTEGPAQDNKGAEKK
jgi:hypothetical protein